MAIRNFVNIDYLNTSGSIIRITPLLTGSSNIIKRYYKLRRKWVEGIEVVLWI